MVLNDIVDGKIRSGVKIFNIPKADPITGLFLMHGNGCPKHPNCFTCTFDDCNFNTSKSGSYYQKVE